MCKFCNDEQKYCKKCETYTCPCYNIKTCNCCKRLLCDISSCDIYYKICACCENWLCQRCWELDGRDHFEPDELVVDLFRPKIKIDS